MTLQKPGNQKQKQTDSLSKCEKYKKRRESTEEKCRCCDKCFSWSSNCKKHEQMHTGEKPYNSKYCDKSFSKSGNCKKHKRIHTGGKTL